MPYMLLQSRMQIETDVTTIEMLCSNYHRFTDKVVISVASMLLLGRIELYTHALTSEIRLAHPPLAISVNMVYKWPTC